MAGKNINKGFVEILAPSIHYLAIYYYQWVGFEKRKVIRGKSINGTHKIEALYS